ncbi:HlyD family type I secretion periplasmic adaptor subunit [Taklimakanibacter deserti]|uniref:HlyD family type I secretion periplasmic adaptor subunit n=1 Tax=Taklimakanibacter deserti TaxID=2267839 RepID=UPI000E658529
MTKRRLDDLAFANDVKAALRESTSHSGWTFIVILAVLMAMAIVWANWAILDEVTTGDGKVISSSKLQVVQSPDGGIVRGLYVKDGDVVEKDQLLLKLDETEAASRLGELHQRRLYLEAQTTRLRAEASASDTLEFSAELTKSAPNAVQAERQAFAARQEKIRNEVEILRRQLLQKEQERLEMGAQRDKLAGALELINRELAMTRKLAKNGAVPEIELIRLERQVGDMQGELAVLDATQPRAEFAIEEAKEKLASNRSVFVASAREDLAKAIGELNILEQSVMAAEQRVRQTELRAPAKGIVNRLSVTSLGAVVRPGFDIVEIVPIEDNLLVEVKIGPRNIGFIRKDQPARVKLTAFDYLQYGALSGKVEWISADTVTDPENNPYYRVIVKTDENSITKMGETMRAIPGMVANVDIMTGRKSVLQYLLTPVLRTRDEAMRER